jgi:hypothetical protein
MTAVLLVLTGHVGRGLLSCRGAKALGWVQNLRLGLLAVAAGALWLGVCQAVAETRALVIGVSGYPNLAASLHLTGPKNDSRELANTLVRLGVPAGNVTVLADQVAGLSDGIANPGPGTRDAILSGLDRLAEESRPGDLAVVYFSGHGTQQPDLDGDEGGGADEVFLPYDAGSWGADGIANALVDDDFRIRIEAMRDKGVDVFGMIDACHSATGFRTLADDDVRAREVDPAALGVPAFAETGPRALRFAQASTERPGRGRAAFFYAAQESEVALERKPAGGTDDDSFGVFTAALVSRLNASPNLTYRTLHQALLADIKRNTLMATQTPALEGDLLDEPVLGLSDAAPRRQWPVFAGKVQAGTLEGMTVGSVVALYADPADAEGKVLAYGRIETAGATRAVAVPAAYCPAEAAACPDQPDESAFRKGRVARIVERGVAFGLTLSEPVRFDPDDGRDYTAALAALKAAGADPRLASRLSVRSDGYDLAVGLVDGKLAFAPSIGLIDRLGPGSSPRLTIPDDPAAARAAVADAVDRMARALALQRLDVGADGAARMGLKSGILLRTAPAPVSGGTCPDRDDAYAPPVPATDNPAYGECDILAISMENAGRKPLDVTVLLIGADFSITPVWPNDGLSNRIQIGETKAFDILQMEASPDATTEERLIFLAVPGVNKANTAFTDLGQDGLRAMPAGTPEIEAVRDLVAAALDGATRSAATAPVRIDEEMAIDVRPFIVTKGAGG